MGRAGDEGWDVGVVVGGEGEGDFLGEMGEVHCGGAEF